MLKKIVSRIYISSFTRFIFVGGLGTIVNLIGFFLVADIFHYDANLAAVIAFSVAVTQNYLLNHRFSFKRHSQEALSFLAFLRYVAVNLIGLSINLLVINLLLANHDIHPKVIAQFFGIGAGTLVNYFGSRLFVFRRKKKQEATPHADQSQD